MRIGIIIGAFGVLLALGPRTFAQAPADSAERLHEMAVEIAWCADPMTFPCPLQVWAENGKLHLSGVVPHPAVRDRALAIARHASSLPIDDRIEFEPHLLPRLDRVSPMVLHHAVHEALQNALRDESRRLSIALDSEGQIVLQGTVTSRRAQLEATRALRAVPGVICVRNHAQLDPTARPEFGASTAQPTAVAANAPTPPTQTDSIIPIRNVDPPAPPAPSQAPYFAPSVPAAASSPQLPSNSEPPALTTGLKIAFPTRRSPSALPPIPNPTLSAPVPQPAAAPLAPLVGDSSKSAGGERVSFATKSAPTNDAFDLEQRIRNLTGFRGGMQVQRSNDGRVTIRLSVRTEDEANAVGPAILYMPDLKNCPVQIIAAVESPVATPPQK